MLAGKDMQWIKIYICISVVDKSSNLMKKTLSITTGRLSYFMLALILCTTGCRFDEQTVRHNNYNSAVENSILDKGWIPKEIVAESMTDLYLRTNVSTNEAIFYFRLSDSDLLKVKSVTEQEINPSELKTRIKTPRWWRKQVAENNYNRYKYADASGMVYLLIDQDNNGVYGWR